MSEKLLCGSCKVPAETVANAKPSDPVTCPKCGRTDRYETAMKSGGEYLASQVGDAITQGFLKANRPGSMIKFSAKPRPRRSFRWIIGKGR